MSAPRSSPNPYAAHDPRLTHRFAAMVWAVTAVVVLVMAPFAATPGSGAAGLLAGAASGAVALALFAGWRPGYNALLALSWVSVPMVLVLQRTMTGAGIDELYFGIALGAAALHPVRRVWPLVVVVAVVSTAGELGEGSAAADVIDAVVEAAVLAAVAIVASALTSQMREQRAVAQHGHELAEEQSLTDALTELGNRRRLLRDLDATFASGSEALLVLFDLDGFKAYNDTYGHPAGDALLQRLGGRLASSVVGRGAAYRLGGDEFCVLADVRSDALDAFIAATVDALSERGDGFDVVPSHGEVRLLTDVASTAEALREADHRMYARKSTSRTSAGRQSTDVLLSVLRERNPDLSDHVDGVAALCDEVAERLGLRPEERSALAQAAVLHDIGKAAIPDAIIDKPGPLDADEWAFMRRHTLIGERILVAAPSLACAALLVRASHERYDGGGYPDGLAGEEIPLGARIILACDAYDAMTSDRAYRRAMSHEAATEELRRGAGTQFDPVVVTALQDALRDGSGVGRGARVSRAA